MRDSFELDKFLKARELTHIAVNKVAANVYAGMNEEDGLSLIDQILNEMGTEKKWHPNKFRIGKNTTKSFRDKSEENIRLEDNDIFFIDIGPVWENHEGDFGKTFVYGSNEELSQFANDAKIVFEKTAEVWKEDQLSGIALYECANKYANELGYKLNNRMKGHRIGDFPHHLFYRGGMNETTEVPCDNLWILEIHLLTRDEQYGSFYEDILRREF